MCSVEELLPDRDGVMPGDTNGDWALQRQGRYAHSLGYVRDTLPAMRASRCCASTGRPCASEANAPVARPAAVLQRVRHDG